MCDIDDTYHILHHIYYVNTCMQIIMCAYEALCPQTKVAHAMYSHPEYTSRQMISIGV